MVKLLLIYVHWEYSMKYGNKILIIFFLFLINKLTKNLSIKMTSFYFYLHIHNILLFSWKSFDWDTFHMNIKNYKLLWNSYVKDAAVPIYIT